MYSLRSIERYFSRISIPLSFELGGVVILTPPTTTRAKVTETYTRAVSVTLTIHYGSLLFNVFFFNFSTSAPFSGAFSSLINVL